MRTVHVKMTMKKKIEKGDLIYVPKEVAYADTVSISFYSLPNEEQDDMSEKWEKEVPDLDSFNSVVTILESRFSKSHVFGESYICDFLNDKGEVISSIFQDNDFMTLEEKKIGKFID